MNFGVTYLNAKFSMGSSNDKASRHEEFLVVCVNQYSSCRGRLMVRLSTVWICSILSHAFNFKIK